MDGQYWLSLAINVGVMGIIAFFLKNFFVDIKDIMNKTHDLITGQEVQKEINDNRTNQISEIHTTLHEHHTKIEENKNFCIAINSKVDKLVVAHSYQHKDIIT